MQQEYFGSGCLAQLKAVLEMEKPASIFLVAGKNSYQTSGAQKILGPILHEYKVTFFSDFAVNPQLEDVQRGMALFKDSNCDLIIAIGGGSVLDMAKAINFLAAQPGEPESYITQKLNPVIEPESIIMVPTTAGTGSEATHFAVVYINKKKYSLAHKWMLPKYVFLDPSVTLTLPKNITAATGADALCQAIESYWSVQSTEESKLFAREAIKLILENLVAAVNDPSPTNREAMMKAANLAGKAINISKTTACHSVSYPITSYFGVPHGHACALTLSEIFLYNSRITKTDCLDQRGAEYVSKTLSELYSLFQVRTVEEMQEKINLLIDQIGLSRKLTRLNIHSQENYNLIVANGFNPERVKNNPRELTETALREILKRIS